MIYANETALSESESEYARGPVKTQVKLRQKDKRTLREIINLGMKWERSGGDTLWLQSDCFGPIRTSIGPSTDR